eukprot:g21209.t2
MLNVQYRMHPLLSAFPSQAFYEGKLLDAIMQTPVEKPPSWKYKHNLVVVPVFDQESPKGTSHMNEGEAEVLVKHLEDYLENGGSEESIGVKLLRRMLKSRHIKTGLQGVEVNSVDGFQGREKEVIMISTVRSNEQNTTGFVRDWRRVNVAMTRAKYALLVVCNPRTLARDKHSWLPWLNWSQYRGFWLNDEDLDLPEPPKNKGKSQSSRFLLGGQSGTCIVFLAALLEFANGWSPSMVPTRRPKTVNIKAVAEKELGSDERCQVVTHASSEATSARAEHDDT